MWDIGPYNHPLATSTADRVRAQNLGMDFTVLAQGVPFVHAGEDLLRSKSMDRNSYDSGDWFNRVDFSGHDEPLGRRRAAGGRQRGQLGTDQAAARRAPGAVGG